LVQEQPQTDTLGHFGEILRQYGEAMLRIGQFEAQVERLTEGRQSPPLRHDQAGLAELSEKLEDVPKQVASSTGARPSPDSGDDADRDDELGQMQIQIASLSHQFARAERDLQPGPGHRSRHRGHEGKRGPWWKKAARKLGLRGSSSRSYQE
jgi:hypothetical protein